MGSIGIVRETPPAVDLVWQAVEIGERVTSAILLAAISPVIGASVVAVSLLSRRTPLIAHRRVGWCGATLWMIKLRTMWSQDSPRAATGSHWIERIHDDEGPENKQDSDPRVTHWFARFCRRHSLDELPQLWHVIAGEMSLVGPRPAIPSEVEHYQRWQRRRLRMRPGLTCLWAVSGRDNVDFDSWMKLDMQYIDNWSLALDWKILLRTIPRVLTGHGAN